MRAFLCAFVVTASRDFFQVPVTNGFLASPVARERIEILPERVYQPMSASYTTSSASVAMPSNDLLTTSCVVAMCAVVGYSIGRSASQPRAATSKPQQFYRAKPSHSRINVIFMDEEAAVEEAPAEEAEEAPAPAPEPAPVPKVDVSKMIGTYQWADSNGNRVFDPLNLASKYDVNWLREAELKHGRVTMLAIVGFLANDAGIKFPAERFQGISSVDAHDAMVQTGDMWTLLAVVGACEAVHMSKVVPRLDGDWEGWEPGNYGLDPFGWASDTMRERELKHSRLAMIAFGGLVTQSALGYSVFGS
jgi:hypothetical protein